MLYDAVYNWYSYVHMQLLIHKSARDNPFLFSIPCL